jgi:hypothetical protein
MHCKIVDIRDQHKNVLLAYITFFTMFTENLSKIPFPAVHNNHSFYQPANSEDALFLWRC